MATSGSIALIATGTDIITEALEQLGVLADGQAPNANQLTSCNRTLNYMVKAFQAEGLNLFALQRTYVFTQKDTNQYPLSSASNSAHWTTSFVATRLAVAAIATATAITVQDATGINDTDQIGIVLDDGTTFWTTVNGAPVGDVITITDALPEAANEGNVVYSYVTRAERPMKIQKAVRSIVGGSDIPLPVVVLDEYADLPNKTDDGYINTLYYDPQIGTGFLYTWPENDNPESYLTLWVQRTLDDIVDPATDDLDFPQEWYLALAFNLALLLTPKYDPPTKAASLISTMAKFYKDEAMGWDQEDTIEIQPANKLNRSF